MPRLPVDPNDPTGAHNLAYVIMFNMGGDANSPATDPPTIIAQYCVIGPSGVQIIGASQGVITVPLMYGATVEELHEAITDCVRVNATARGIDIHHVSFLS